MLVQCEIYEVDGMVTCDTICERCGEVAARNVMMREVGKQVRAGTPAICEDCENSRCRRCGKYPATKGLASTWMGGVCWECQDKALEETRKTLARLAYVVNMPI